MGERSPRAWNHSRPQRSQILFFPTLKIGGFHIGLAGPVYFITSDVSLRRPGPRYARTTLIHEMTHVWQGETQFSPLICVQIDRRAGQDGSRAAYNYRPLRGWTSYNLNSKPSWLKTGFKDRSSELEPLYSELRQKKRNCLSHARATGTVVNHVIARTRCAIRRGTRKTFAARAAISRWRNAKSR